MNIVALIPARAGSKRVPGKNTRLLGGKPLVVWTIDAAKASGVFADIIVSSDDDYTGALAKGRGVRWCPRLEEHATDTSPDIDWVRHALALTVHDAFAILRPTSPFRTADTIRRAWARFQDEDCSSLRAVQKVREHPGKMWQAYGPESRRMEPLIGTAWPPEFPGAAQMHTFRTPWHSQPTQSLPTVYVQNSSLEMAWTWCVKVFGTISGPQVAPFFTEGMEGFSIDYEDDFTRAEAYAQTLLAGAQSPPAA